MGWLVLIGPSLFIAASLAVGLRCVRLGMRNRQIPEWAIGVTMLSAGVGGYGLIGGLPLLPGLPKGVLHASSALGDIAVSVGAASLYLFTWRTYRLDSPWAQWVFLASATLMAGITLGMLWTWSYPLPYADRPAWYPVTLAIQTASFGWSSFEDLRYWRLMRRRMRLGLADPEIAQRMLNWGIAAASACILTLIYSVAWMEMGTLIPSLEVVALLSLPGLVAAVNVWLAFFPPASYLRHFAPTPERAE